MDNTAIVAGSTSLAVLGIHTLDRSKQKRRMARMEAHITELESMITKEARE